MRTVTLAGADNARYFRANDAACGYTAAIVANCDHCRSLPPEWHAFVVRVDYARGVVTLDVDNSDSRSPEPLA